MNRAERDRQYSPSSVAPDYLEILGRCARDSERARCRLSCELDIGYGPDPAERLDFYPAARPGPLHVFVHGGHWQEGDRRVSAFVAEDFVQAGASFIALGYGLAPDYPLPVIAEQVRRGLSWIGAHARELGASSIHASGSSAGAHLLALAASSPYLPLRLQGITLLSGVYDLEPLVGCYVNDALAMTAEVARAHSPIGRSTPTVPVVLAIAEHETEEYFRQHRLYADALSLAGNSPIELVIAGRNHFDLPVELARPDTVLGAAVLRQLTPG